MPSKFIGVIDEECKRTSRGQDVFVLRDNSFSKAFEELIKEAYRDLFEVRGDDAWALGKNDLISYFRATDKTSDVIGGRQAGLFQAFRALAGYEQPGEKALNKGSSKPKATKLKTSTQKKVKPKEPTVPKVANSTYNDKENRRDMAMTVRIEINLPANGSQETYDAIFKSIRANLIDD